MHLTKNTIYHNFFYLLILLSVIFNGGNYYLFVQFNFILILVFFYFCLKDINYKAHIKKFYLENKKIFIIYSIFLFYLIFQIIPMPLELLKFLSPIKYNLLINIHFENSLSTISFDPYKSYFNFLNYCSLVFYLLVFKSIFYKERHVINFYFHLSFICFIASTVAIYFFLIGNTDFMNISNNSYPNSATGFFINRTVFACFLNLGFLASLEYLNNVDRLTKGKKDYFYNKIYVRLFILFITIGIITSFSKLGNFLFLILISINILRYYLDKRNQNKFIFYSLIIIIVFDIFILGFYFGGSQLFDRFAFLKSELTVYVENNSQFMTLSRGDLAKFGFSQLDKFLLFGYGGGAFEVIFKNFYSNLDINYTNHSHFDLAEFVGELGLVGVSPLILVIYKSLRKLTFKSLNNIKNIFLFVFILFILIFDFSLHIPIIQLLLILILGINIKRVS